MAMENSKALTKERSRLLKAKDSDCETSECDSEVCPLDESFSSAEEEIQALRQQIQTLRNENRCLRISASSPNPKKGKACSNEAAESATVVVDGEAVPHQISLHHRTNAAPAAVMDSDDNDEESGLIHKERSQEQQKESFSDQIKDRAGWLVALLCLQSLSSFIISRNEALLQQHIVIVQFLTMLVGAGGNAGNQASVRVIRGLAVGTITNQNVRSYLKEEIVVGFTLMFIIGVSGCIRAAVFMIPLAETIAITFSLCSIVLISILLGSTLPLGMKALKIDPAHSSTTIQVIMDILGVIITCSISRLLLDSPFHAWLLDL